MLWNQLFTFGYLWLLFRMLSSKWDHRVKALPHKARPKSRTARSDAGADEHGSML